MEKHEYTAIINRLELLEKAIEKKNRDHMVLKLWIEKVAAIELYHPVLHELQLAELKLDARNLLASDVFKVIPPYEQKAG